MKDDFSNISVGEKVIVNQTHGVKSVRTVKKVNKIHFIVDMGNYEIKFRKSDGSRAGKSDMWSICYATVPKEGDIEKINAENKKANLVSYLERYCFNELPLEKLEEVFKIIRK